jgi:hypothetical protein
VPNPNSPLPVLPDFSRLTDGLQQIVKAINNAAEALGNDYISLSGDNTFTGNNTFTKPVTLPGVTVINGATVVSNGLADYQQGAWTPVDGSGATLAFTSVDAEYTIIGNLVVASFALTYPSTADGSAAIIGGLPTNAANRGAGVVSPSTYDATAPATRPVRTTANASTLTFSGTVTNANLSLHTISGTIIYPFS